MRSSHLLQQTHRLQRRLHASSGFNGGFVQSEQLGGPGGDDSCERSREDDGERSAGEDLVAVGDVLAVLGYEGY